MTIIYTLSDPITGNVKYVGKTKNIDSRLSGHISNAKSDKIKKTLNLNWIKSLISKGLRPIIQEIDSCEDSDWEWMESYWISQMKTWGFKLKNFSDGGVSPKFYDKVTNRSYSKKSVVEYDLNGEFICIHNNIKSIPYVSWKMSMAIRRCCLGYSKMAYGKIWKYNSGESYPTTIEPYSRKAPKTAYKIGSSGFTGRHSDESKLKQSLSHGKSVTNTITGQVFANISIASRESGISRSKIRYMVHFDNNKSKLFVFTNGSTNS